MINKIKKLLPIAAMITNCAYGQTLKAGELEKMCVSTQEAEKGMCHLITKVYLDGFIEGQSKGVFDVYKFDAKVYEQVKDIKTKEIQPRINDVIEKGNCLKKVPVSSVVQSYVEYLNLHGEERIGHYRNTMTRTILQYFCGKK